MKMKKIYIFIIIIIIKIILINKSQPFFVLCIKNIHARFQSKWKEKNWDNPKHYNEFAMDCELSHSLL